MPNPEKGAGWEIFREWTDPDKAVRAGEQLLELVTSGSPYISEFPDLIMPPDQDGLEVFRFHAWSAYQYPEYHDTVTEDPEAATLCQDAIDIHRRASKFVSTHIRAGIIHIYEPGGHTRKHRDSYKGETLAVSLFGFGEVSIKDSATGVVHYFDMLPGDAMKIINPRTQGDRPLHKVKNVGDDFRISLVE